MACMSCAQRRQALGQMAKNLAKGQSVRPQVQTIRQTVSKDMATLRLKLLSGKRR